MENERRIIEVNGIKMELDMRSATVRTLDAFKVGDTVKVLVKKYDKEYRSHAGIIVGFDDFKDNPTIIVMYLGDEYGSSAVNWLYINAQNTESQIVRANEDDVLFSQEMVVDKMNREIEKAKANLTEAQTRKDVFFKYFGKVLDINERLSRKKSS